MEEPELAQRFGTGLIYQHYVNHVEPCLVPEYLQHQAPVVQSLRVIRVETYCFGVLLRGHG